MKDEGASRRTDTSEHRPLGYSVRAFAWAVSSGVYIAISQCRRAVLSLPSSRPRVGERPVYIHSITMVDVVVDDDGEAIASHHHHTKLYTVNGGGECGHDAHLHIDVSRGSPCIHHRYRSAFKAELCFDASGYSVASSMGYTGRQVRTQVGTLGRPALLLQIQTRRDVYVGRRKGFRPFLSTK